MIGTSQSLHLKQQQSMVMTPQLQMSLKLLQFSSQELLEFIDAELAKNPLLEREDNQENSTSDTHPLDENFSQESESSSNQTTPAETPDTLEITEQTTTLPNDDHNVLDMNYEDTWENSHDAIERSQQSSVIETDTLHIQTGSGHHDGESYIERTIGEEKTLQDLLLENISLDFPQAAERLIALALIDRLDASGYINSDFSSIKLQFGCDDALIETVLLRLQQSAPAAGIFARTLQECLRLQCAEKNRLDPAMDTLLSHLDYIAKGELQRLMRVCGVDAEDMMEMIAEIRQLNPKPALQFQHEITQTAQADIFLRRLPDGSYTLELNNETLPRLLVNRRYYSEIKHRTKTEHDKEYLIEQLHSANWLVKALNQRAETILKVATELVAQQRDFFEKGIYYLKPMTLQAIAQKIDVHESTVGRVTSNKYLSTPRGLFELKYFFSTAITSSIGKDDFSNKTVKHIIKEIIDQERSANDVLSDDKIAEILQQKGMGVARRTVAKYRESMNIPSSAERKQSFKKL